MEDDHVLGGDHLSPAGNSYPLREKQKPVYPDMEAHGIQEGLGSVNKVQQLRKCEGHREGLTPGACWLLMSQH